MKAIPGALSAHLSQGETTLAGYVRITRTDSQVFAFSEHDRDLTIASVVHKPLMGARSKLAANADLSIPNLDLASVIDDAGLTEDDLASGLFDGAAVEIGLVNWASPADGVIVLLRGFIGEVRREGVAFHCDVRGLGDRLAQSIGERTSPTCRAVLGDARCGISLTNFTTTGTVTAVTSRRAFAVSFADLPGGGGPPPASGYFDNAGVLTWTAGANNGRMHLVRGHSAGGNLELYLPAYHDIQINDTFSVHAGCDKILLGHCQTRFDNVANFVGEPHVPGVNVGLQAQSG